MSWWLIAVVVLVVLRLTRRRRWERRAFGRWQGRQFGWGRPPWDRGLPGRVPDQVRAAPPPSPPPLPDPGRDLERTIDAVRQEYVAGRITVEEYERRLDELYRTAQGKRLTSE